MKVDINFNITPKALEEIRKTKISDPQIQNSYLRVSVEGGGCSGFMYGLGFDNEFDEKLDMIDDYDNIKVIIDKKSALYLNNVTLDWIDDLNNRGFKFNNPNATKNCGCGKSFQ
jgi:iron-sulfur cluster assembly protein